MKLTSEAKLLAVLAAIVLVGGGFLLLSSRGANGPGDVRPSPTPAPQLDSAAVDALLKASRHVKGDPNAPLTIIEFADFQCPSCRRAFSQTDKPNVHDIEKKLPARFAFLNLPLPMHENAVPAAAAAEAAAKQGKFWEMYNVLFEGSDVDAPLSDADLVKHAQKAGLNIEQFNKDRADAAVNALIDADKAVAEKYSVDMTPTFVIRDKNGKVKVISGAGPYSELFPDLKDGILDNQPGPAAPAAAPPGPMAPGPQPVGPPPAR
jgi:protein-disulfide isomerase